MLFTIKTWYHAMTHAYQVRMCKHPTYPHFGLERILTDFSIFATRINWNNLIYFPLDIFYYIVSCHMTRMLSNVYIQPLSCHDALIILYIYISGLQQIDFFSYSWIILTALELIRIYHCRILCVNASFGLLK